MIVLDTHAFLWWRDESSRLSRKARTAIEGAEQVGVPTVCCLELTTLERRGRIALERGAARWVRAALAGVKELELTTEIAIAAGRLTPPFPGDPVDRVVYATALAVGAPLVTSDRRITSYDPERIVW